MRIAERRAGDVIILDMTGKFTVITGPRNIKTAITNLVLAGRKNIVLNLAEVTYIDSSGLGELVACYQTAERHGASIKLANANGRMRDVLVLTRLFSLFESHQSEASAVASFGSAAA